MDRNLEKRLIAELGRLIEGRSTAMTDGVRPISTCAMVDPERLRREREVLFREYPLAIGLGAAVARPGDFLAGEAAGFPYLVVRDDDGVLRAFANICRHRGHTVCKEAAGNRRTFSCDYHSWTYDRRGRCLSFTDAKAFAGEERAARPLVSLPVEERHGLIWIRPRPGEAPVGVAAHLGEALDAELAGYERFMAHTFRAQTTLLPFDWKLALDTFCEFFHLDHLHPQSLKDVFLGNVGTCETFGRHFRSLAVRPTFRAMFEGPEEAWTILPHAVIIYYVFPNVMVIWQLDHIELWQLYPVPGRDGVCQLTVSLLTDEPATSPEAVRHWEKNWDVMVRTVFEEDFAAMERIQRNLETGVVDELVYGRNEVALQHFRRVVGEAVDRATTP